MSVKTIARITGSLVAILAVVAFFFLDRQEFPGHPNDQILWLIGIAVASAVFMFLVTPYITVVPYHWMRDTSASDLVAAIIGLIVGLIISVLLAIPLGNLPSNLGRILPFAGAVLFSFLGVALAVQRKTILRISSKRVSSRVELRASASANVKRNAKKSVTKNAKKRVQHRTSRPHRYCWIPVPLSMGASPISARRASSPAHCSFHALC